MPELTVRTRYAPSPTGFMHVGNLRTALYEYLVAKSQNGKFILRIEDTDRERLVDGAVDVIYNTLKLAGLQHDEGPDLGGDFGPYVQSERKDMYLPYAEQLIKEGKAYRCFCSKERLEKIQNETVGGGYDRHCRDLPQEEIDRLLAEGVPYVIRQKMPIEGSTTFTDAVFGEITVEIQSCRIKFLLKQTATRHTTLQMLSTTTQWALLMLSVAVSTLAQHLSTISFTRHSVGKFLLIFTSRSLWVRTLTAMYPNFQSVTVQQAFMI